MCIGFGNDVANRATIVGKFSTGVSSMIVSSIGAPCNFDERGVRFEPVYTRRSPFRACSLMRKLGHGNSIHGSTVSRFPGQLRTQRVSKYSLVGGGLDYESQISDANVRVKFDCVVTRPVGGWRSTRVGNNETMNFRRSSRDCRR